MEQSSRRQLLDNLLTITMLPLAMVLVEQLHDPTSRLRILIGDGRELVHRLRDRQRFADQTQADLDGLPVTNIETEGTSA